MFRLFYNCKKNMFCVIRSSLFEVVFEFIRGRSRLVRSRSVILC